MNIEQTLIQGGAAGRAQWLAMRQADVTASAAACLFGAKAHPYITAFEYYCLKAKLVSEDPEETPAMRRGRLLEPIALQLLSEEKPNWAIGPALHYYRDADARIGATPDAFAVRDTKGERGVVQIKTVGKYAFRNGWTNSAGLVEPPLWIAVQTNIEAYLTGCKWGCVAAMALGDGGLDMHVVDIPVKPKLIEKLKELTAEFWDRVASRRAYPADYEADAEIVKALYADDDGGAVSLQGPRAERAIALVGQRNEFKAVEAAAKDAEKKRKLIDVELIDILGNAAAGILPNGTVIDAKTVRRKGYEVQPTSFRSVTVKGFIPDETGSTDAGAEQRVAKQQSPIYHRGPF
jgi:predicted phage-related endonuclease